MSKENKSHSSNKSKVFILIFLILFIAIIAFVIYKNINKSYGLNQSFKFDNLQITLGNNYSFDVIDDDYTIYKGKTVIKLPVTIKNVGNESNSLSMFDYKIFGPDSSEVDSVSTFYDDAIDFAGELQKDEQYTMYFYFVYNGNGKYSIQFDNLSEKVKAEFVITK